MRKVLHIIFIGAIIFLASIHSPAQDKRAQYPPFLVNSYFGVNIGYINYPFTEEQLEPGNHSESIDVPHTGVRVFFGHQFNKWLSAQITYMRPVFFVEYRNLNGSDVDYQVGMNVLGLTIKPTLPISNKIVLNGEVGVAIVTRSGFIVINAPGVKDATNATILLGGGVAYRLNKNWRLTLNASMTPASEKVKQPSTEFYSAGFDYTMTRLSREKVDRNSNAGFIFPRQVMQIAYTTNAIGYGANEFTSNKVVPIFWSGAVRIKQGISLNYQRNVFHTRKVFSFDWGAGTSFFQTRQDKQNFFTLAFYPVFRFSFFRSTAADFYFMYSLAGPALVSRTIADGRDTGTDFTFQDFMGFGAFAGKNRQLNAEIRITHFSNGNIFPQNSGFMIPLTFGVGYTFDKKSSSTR